MQVGWPLADDDDDDCQLLCPHSSSPSVVVFYYLAKAELCGSSSTNKQNEVECSVVIVSNLDNAVTEVRQSRALS